MADNGSLFGWMNDPSWKEEYRRYLEQHGGGIQPLQPMGPPATPPGFSLDYQGGSPDMPQLTAPPSGFGNNGGFLGPQGIDPGGTYAPPPQDITDPSQPWQQANAGGSNGLLGGSGMDTLSPDTGATGKPWGPMLMALGGGIASGAGFGQGGWGGGIGRGLTAAAAVRQNQSELDLKKQAYALQLQELKNQQAYQNATLTQGEARNELDRQLRRDKLDETKAQHDETNTQKEAELASPLSIVGSSAGEYANSRKVLTADHGPGSWTRYWSTGGGEIGRAMDPIKRALDGAALIKKVDPKILYDAFLPSGPEDAKAKLDAFEAYMKGLKGSLAQANPTQSDSLNALDAFTTPSENVTPPPDAGGAPPVAAGTAGGTGGAHYRFNQVTGKLELVQ